LEGFIAPGSQSQETMIDDSMTPKKSSVIIRIN